MISKTIKGKKCPQCSSFIKADQAKCNVCGFDFELENKSENESEIAVTVKSESNTIVCPKCQTQNNPEFKFCKICKYPLKEMPPGRTGDTTKLQLRLEWLKTETDDFFEKELDFHKFLPYFDGCLQWQGYAFFAYKAMDNFEMLARKIEQTAEAKLYKKCQSADIETSGKEFFAGAVKIKLLGASDSDMEMQTVISSDKTVFVGPGEAADNTSAKTGTPRIRIINMGLEEDIIEIPGKTLIGRDFLAKQTTLAAETMRKSGISSEHFYLTPSPGARWLIEPLPDKPIFIEICAEPVALKSGDILRLVAGRHVGEFKIGIRETGI